MKHRKRQRTRDDGKKERRIKKEKSRNNIVKLVTLYPVYVISKYLMLLQDGLSTFICNYQLRYRSNCFVAFIMKFSENMREYYRCIRFSLVKRSSKIECFISLFKPVHHLCKINFIECGRIAGKSIIYIYIYYLKINIVVLARSE